MMVLIALARCVCLAVAVASHHLLIMMPLAVRKSPMTLHASPKVLNCSG